MALERSIQSIAHQAPEADPLVRDARELAQFALDIGGCFLKALWSGLSHPGDSSTVRKRTCASAPGC
jgi:hypothetical protein